MPSEAELHATDVLASLVESRAALLAFIRSKVADPDAAEDLLQESLLKALRSAPMLRDEDRLVSWFYQIVRHAIADYYRRQGREARHLEAYARDLEAHTIAEEQAQLCACVEKLIPTLKPEYADVIVRVDLGGAENASTAEALGITPENLKVRRMRARRQLRQRLEETCRTCATHGCLDCTCGT